VSRLSEFRKILASYFTRSVVGLLAKTPLTPNTITWIGFVVTVGAGVLIVTGHLFAAGFVVLAAGFFDILDGALARHTNRVTRFGGVLDSTLDRLAEAVILIGLLVVYAREQAVAEVVLVSVTLIGSQLVSYVRARAEGLGLKCEIGIFTRAERVVLLALGLLLSQFDYALIIALTIILVFSYVTVGQRLFYVWQQTKN
jgi:CDP-diacylglycerol--glycerol-3-phosphate 3-phosphatidyltransferase